MNRCPDCGIDFQCSVVQSGDGAPCWCMQLPPLPMSAGMKGSRKARTAGCFCPACLQRRIEEAKKAKEIQETEEVKNQQ
jgi:hypothetical protein